MNKELITAHGIDLLELVEETSRVYVWKAVQRTLERSVFIVILKEQPSGNPVETEYFLRVARHFAKIKCESLAAVFDIVSEKNLHYAIVEYIEGDSLDRIVAANGPMDYHHILEVATSVSSALRQLWETSRVIHRNIKGKTIRFDERGIAKLMDFSLAVVDSPDFDSNVIDKGQLLGTPSFISPEHAAGNLKFSIQSDMYALGALLYYLSTGKAPFEDLAVRDILRQQTCGLLPPPHRINPAIPVDFSRLLHKMMMKDPAKRYGNWEELHHDLHCLLEKRQPVCKTLNNADAVSTITPDFSEAAAENNKKQLPAIRLKTKKRSRYLEDIQDRHVSHHHKSDEKSHMIRTQLLLWAVLIVWLAAVFRFRSVIQTSPENKTELPDRNNHSITNPEKLMPETDARAAAKTQPDQNILRPEETEPNAPAMHLPAGLIDNLARQFRAGDISAAVQAVSDRNPVLAGRQQLTDMLNNIPSAETLVSKHLHRNTGKPLVMNFKGKPRKVIPVKVQDEIVTLEANGRSIDFRIAELSAEQKVNWIDPPRTEEENIAYCLLLLQTWRAKEAAIYADKCGILAPVIKKAAEL
ncbi:MAG: serine/threonine-protein kinase [Kiritimatiellia bacterium]